jgi:hypothetical protein
MDYLEFETWVDEEIGGGRACDDGSCARPHGVFEGSNRRGADGDDATRSTQSLVDGGGSVGGDGIRLGMDLVIFDALDADGLKSSQADMQGYIDSLHLALADAVEDFPCEMKASGGGCYRSTLLRIDGLIPLPIMGRIRSRDIRREWDVADAVESSEEIDHGLKTDAAQAEFRAGQDLGLQFIPLAEKQAFADADLAAGPNQAFPIVGLGGELAGQENLDAAAEEIACRRIVRAERVSAGALAAAIEPGWKDAGVVENEQVAALQELREMAEQAVGTAAGGSLQVEHAGTIASGKGFLGNEVVGKMEVEVGNQHAARL